jgi:hypothetical protein
MTIMHAWPDVLLCTVDTQNHDFSLGAPLGACAAVGLAQHGNRGSRNFSVTSLDDFRLVSNGGTDLTKTDIT